jgi:hypothetical protein
MHLARPFAALFLACALGAAPLFAFDSPLSEQAIREAYFLGQRNDGTAAKFFEAYRHYFPVPESGPHVSVIELWTPFAQAVDRSRGKRLGYSAQQAERDCRALSDSVRVGVHVRYTPTYGPGFPYSPDHVPGATGTWKDFQIQLRAKGKLIRSRSLRYEGERIGNGRYGSKPIGFTAWLQYDPGDLPSTDVTVEVDTPDGQHVATVFDLDSLR